MIIILITLFIISGILVWYFTKRKPNTLLKNLSYGLMLVIFISAKFAIPNHNQPDNTSHESEPRSSYNNKKKSINKSPKKHHSTKRNSTSDSEDNLKYYAQAFGNQDAESIQKTIGGPYSTSTLDGNIVFNWKTKLGTMIRIDDNSTGITTVYLKDSSKPNNLGEKLYTGHTIYQKSQKSYLNYN
ncbi:hypothetical protein FHL04_03055 [Lactobacillus salsicarnum]|nr:hypothetical protein [Companilactobacillus mishanensis]